MPDYNILDEVRGLLGEDDAPKQRTARVSVLVQVDTAPLSEVLQGLVTQISDLMDALGIRYRHWVHRRAATMTPVQQRQQYAIQRTRAARRRKER